MKTYTRIATAFTLTLLLVNPLAAAPREFERERPVKKIVRLIKTLIGTNSDVMSPPTP